MSIFGWSYPPGCSGPPDEPAICEVCNGDVDADRCICPECPVCGNYGDPDCYENHGMVMTFEQIKQYMFLEMCWHEDHLAFTKGYAEDILMCEQIGDINETILEE